jgi:hypothetical protein
MNTNLYYMVTEQRGVELRRAAERARLATEVSGRRHKMRDPAPVLRRRDMTVLEVEQASGGAR